MRKVITARVARLSVVVVALVGLLIATSTLTGSATGSSNVTSLTLGRGTDQSEGTIPIRQGMDVVVVENTFAPGGASGWHSHPGGAIIVLARGQLTVFRSLGDQCEVTTYTAGQTFIERPGDVQNTVNNGSSPAFTIVTFPGVPVGHSPRIDQPDPGTCPGV